jgi:hypothetical protein
MSNIIIDNDITIFIRQDGSDIKYSSDQSNWIIINSWPCTIIYTLSGGVGLLVFVTDLTLTNANQYFISGSSHIQFGSTTVNTNGTRPMVYIDNITNYLGFIQNGSSGSNGYNNISIYNLDIRSNSSSLAMEGGWLGQSYFSKGAINNYIYNCTSNGDIDDSCGGIIGSNSANDSGNLTICGCTSSGSMFYGGGIVGSSSANNGTILVDRCSSTGFINYSGGIYSNGCGTNSGSATATNCYSTGAMNAGGGIFGSTAGLGGSAIATNCYSTGNMDAGSGGIYCVDAGKNSGTAIATNCYSTGNMITSCGGIYTGSIISYGNVLAYNCYTSGLITGINSGGIWAGSSSDTLQGSNNYAESNHSSSGWNSTNANLRLTGVPTSSNYGTTWSSLSVNTPYILSNSGYTPYSTSLINTISSSVIVGNSTSAAIVPGYTYSILAINNSNPSLYPFITINNSTGSINISSDTPINTYTIIIYSTKNPYSITIYLLTTGNNIDIQCCALPLNLNNIQYNTRNQIITGNTLLGETNRRSPYPSYSFLYYMSMANVSKRI